MRSSFRGLRLGFALLIALPMVPLTWLSGSTANAASFGACAATGRACGKCERDTCVFGYNQVLRPLASINQDRCIDYDGVPPGHCAEVLIHLYDIMYVHRNGYYEEMGMCSRSECQANVIWTTRPCFDPLYL